MGADNSRRTNYWIFYVHKLNKNEILEKIALVFLGATLVFFVNYKIRGQVDITGIVISIGVSLILNLLFSEIKENWKVFKSLKKYKSEFGQLLRQVLSTVLDSVFSKDTAKQQQYMFSLKEIIDANRDPLKYNPEYKLLDRVFVSKGTLSITESSPAAWLDPTYNFFLMCQYVANIKKRLDIEYQSDSNTKKGFSMSNRSSQEFNSFFKKGKKLIKTLSNIDTFADLISALDNHEVRFYLMSEDTIRNNKGIVEYLVAGHELSGVYLFIIKDTIKNQIGIEELQRSFIGNINDPLDIAFNISNNILNYTKRVEGNTLSEFTLQSEDVRSDELIRVVKHLSSIIYEEIDNNTKRIQNKYLIYPQGFGGFNETLANIDAFILNHKNCYVNIN